MTYDRTATAWASSSWAPAPPPSPPHEAGDSEGVTSATYSPSGRTFTVRAWLLELTVPCNVPRTVRLPPTRHSWSASFAKLGSAGNGSATPGDAVGDETPVAICVQGPAQPPAPG